MFFEASCSPKAPFILSPESVFSCSFSVVTGDKDTIEAHLKEDSIFNGKVITPKDMELNYGSGFLLNSLNFYSESLLRKQAEKFYILTSFHVIENSLTSDQKSVYVCGSDSPTCQISSVELIDALYDIALLSISVLPTKCEGKFKILENPKVGSFTFSFGNRLGLGLSFTSAFISTSARKITSAEISNPASTFLLLDSAATYGNSGGALFSHNLEFIGIIKGIYKSHNSGIVMAIPFSEISLSLERLSQMIKLEENLGFEIFEKDNFLFLRTFENNEQSPFFRKIDFRENESLQYINKRPVKSKADFLYRLFSFIEDKSEDSLYLNFLQEDGRLRRVILEKF